MLCKAQYRFIYPGPKIVAKYPALNSGPYLITSQAPADWAKVTHLFWAGCCKVGLSENTASPFNFCFFVIFFIINVK